MRKGIILAGGKATRLYPITKVVSKQLLPVYNKPMIYYSLSVLIHAGIKDILLISNKEHIKLYKKLFSNTKLKINISFAIQKSAGGIPQAFIIGKEFIGDNSVCLILGDNLFFGYQLIKKINRANNINNKATVFVYSVNNPNRYGVLNVDKNNKPISIVEKPKKPESKWAVTGLYFYPKGIVKIAEGLKPSKRGEIEITDINQLYLKRNKLNVEFLNNGMAWFDMGTFESLINASLYVKTLEDRQNIIIGDLLCER